MNLANIVNLIINAASLGLIMFICYKIIDLVTEMDSFKFKYRLEDMSSNLKPSLLQNTYLEICNIKSMLKKQETIDVYKLEPGTWFDADGKTYEITDIQKEEIMSKDCISTKTVTIEARELQTSKESDNEY